MPVARRRSRLIPTVIAPYTQQTTVFNGICSNPLKSTTTNYNYSVIGESGVDIMDDVVTENFSKRKNKGEIVNSPMRKEVSKVRNTLATFSNDRTYWTSYNCPPVTQLLKGNADAGQTGLSASLPFAPDPVLQSVSNLSDLAVTSAWAGATQSKAAILSTLAEGKESIQSIYSIIQRLYNLIRAIKRRNLKNLGRQLSPKELEDMWMEWRYAIRPLIYDVKSLTNAILHKSPTHDRQTFRGHAVDSATNKTTGEFLWYDGIYPQYQAVTWKEIDVRAGLLCQVSPPSLPEVFGAYDILETLWDVTPFSFIVDWILNVGDTIASFTPSASLKPLASWVVVKETIIRSSVVTGCKFVPIVGRSYRNPFCFIDNCSRYFERTIKMRTPDPQRSILPTFDLRLDALKLLDLAIITRKFWNSSRI